jgi:predicted glycosyltransferase
MREADVAARGKKSTGLIPSKATVSFNIVNTEKTTQGLSLSVVPTPAVTAGGTLGREFTRQGTSSIVVEYSSVLLAPKDSIIGSKSPSDVDAILKNSHITTLDHKPKPLNR